MRIRSIAYSVILAAAVAASVAYIRAQSSAPLRVFASNGFRAVFDDLAPKCEKTIGRQLSTDFGTSTSLQQRAKSGEALDVAVMTSDAIDDLVKNGKLNLGSLVPLGRAGIGIGVPANASKPDIKTPEALKQALLNAKGISYAGDGASRPYIESMMKALGIEKAVAAKTMLEQGSVRAAGNVASGKADVLITLISEILPAPGVALVGPLPARFQHYVSFAAATSVKSENGEAGKSLIACLSGPDAAATLKSKGMEH
jgi:molybdate transport system substrate-binding protein